VGTGLVRPCGVRHLPARERSVREEGPGRGDERPGLCVADATAEHGLRFGSFVPPAPIRALGDLTPGLRSSRSERARPIVCISCVKMPASSCERRYRGRSQGDPNQEQRRRDPLPSCVPTLRAQESDRGCRPQAAPRRLTRARRRTTFQEGTSYFGAPRTSTILCRRPVRDRRKIRRCPGPVTATSMNWR
jgi:hypothetical protein